MASASTKSDKHWDPVVKLTHWSIVLAVLANGAITEGGSGSHIQIGYALAAMLGLRLLWGLIGPAEARFSAFPLSPKRALAHIRDIRNGKNHAHESHNPLGALMVYAIWGTLGVVIATGVAMAGLPPKAFVRERPSVEMVVAPGDHDVEREENLVGEVHEVAVNGLYLLILLHLGGVIFETRRSGRGLILAMLPSRR